MAAVITFENLTKYYGKTLGVEDLNFEIEEGEIFGYLGPNGAGKTTTIRCLMDFCRPTSGSISILGMDAQRKSPEIKKDLSYLSSDIRLYEKLTGKEMIEYQESIRGKSEYADDLVKRLGCNLEMKTKELSKGNKQLVAIVLALMYKPRVLIMDEPTTALDPLNQNKFYEILEEFQDEGTTIFFSSHILPEVERIAEKVAIIKDGKLVSLDSIDDLAAKAVRNVEIRVKGKFDPSDFQLAGVTKVEKISEGVMLTITGDINPLLHKLDDYDVIDIKISHATLEDVFMQYYGEEA